MESFSFYGSSPSARIVSHAMDSNFYVPFKKPSIYKGFRVRVLLPRTFSYFFAALK